MIWPDLLYTLSVKDILGAPVVRRFTSLSSVAAADVQVDVTIYTHTDPDTVAIIQNAFVETTPGAAQTTLAAYINLVESTTIATLLAGKDDNPVAAARYCLARPVNGIVFAGGTVIARGRFSAAAAANTVEGHISGIIIPRGNLQR